MALVHPRRWVSAAAVLTAAMMLAACAGTGPHTEADASAPEPGGRSPGLSVVYLERFVRHIDALPEWDAFQSKGWQGAPIPLLDHTFDGVPVFGSGLSRGVAMAMSGFIHLDRPGAYAFRALSNDGIRMFLDGKMVFEDPGVHSDRLTPEGVFEAPAGGWYPIRILYFQRKGTAALRLQWQPPGMETFSTVPPEALSHTAS